MTDRSILFKAAMVRALIEGRKSQTRRILSPQHLRLVESGAATRRPTSDEMPIILDEASGFRRVGDRAWTWWSKAPPHQQGSRTSWVADVLPAPGDRLWVREAFSGPHGCRRLPPRDWPPACPRWYWADGKPQDGDWTTRKPGIHMPRWASRMTLTVTDVRLERLKAISAEDAAAEGLVKLPATGRYVIHPGDQYFGSANSDPRVVYRWLWNAINGDDAWSANPVVIAISFTTTLRNIDAPELAGAAA